MTRHKYQNGWLKFSQIGGVYKNFNQNLNTMRAIPRCGLHQIVICSFVCSLSLILFLNQLCSNDVGLSPGADFTAEEITQLERKNLIQERCGETTTEKQPRRTKVTPVRFKIEDRHRVMYCDVPKVSVASTYLKGLMLVLSGVVEFNNLESLFPKSTIHEKNPLRMFDANNLADTNQNGVGNFTKFIFVRHPFERLVSAYQDKLAGDNVFYQKAVGIAIIRKYRKEPSALSLQKGHDVTFPEFVDFIVDEWKDGRVPLDVHWRPVVDLCHPCSMEYDFIGKFETLDQDVDYLLQTLNESGLTSQLLKSPGNTKPKTTATLWSQSMKTLSRKQLNELDNIFTEDFRLFGYPQETTEQ